MSSEEEFLDLLEDYDEEECLIAGAKYEFGREGLPQDYKKAVRLYTRACSLGSAAAFSRLGFMYESGKGVDIDYERAFSLYERACELGNRFGYLNLGYLYEGGLGVTKDLEAAKVCFKKACDLGIMTGCDEFARLEDAL